MKILSWFAMGIKYIFETLNSMISKHKMSVLISSKSIRDQPCFNKDHSTVDQVRRGYLMAGMEAMMVIRAKNNHVCNDWRLF